MNLFSYFWQTLKGFRQTMKKGNLLIFALILLVSNGFCQEPADSKRFSIDEASARQFHQKIDSLYLVGDYNEAIERTLILLDYYSQNDDVRGEIICNNYLGDLLRAFGKYQQGLKYLQIALDLNKGIHDSLLFAKTYNLLAAIYFEYKYPTYLDSANYYGIRSATIARQQGDDKILYSDLNILGRVEDGRGNLEMALKYLEQSLEIVRRVSQVDESLVLASIAGVYFNQGKLRKAEKLALEAYNLAIEYNIMIYIRLSCSLLEVIYIQTHQYEQAHHFAKELHAATRNYLNEKTEKRINDMMLQIEHVHRDIEVQKELERRRLYLIFLSVLIGCGVIFIIIIYLQKRKMKMVIRELKKANSEIQKQKEEMEKIASNLDTSNATLKKFISIIAHDLKNPFNTIIGFSDLLKTEFDNLSPDERKLAIENTHKSSVSAYALLEQLLEWARLQTGTFQMNIEKLDLSEVVDEIISFQQPSAFLKNQHIQKDIPKGLYIYMDINMMLTIFRNLLSNAIKFTPEGGEIKITAAPSGNMVALTIADNGVGISSENMDKLFRIDEQYKTPGTIGEKGTGIGLLLCHEYVEKSGGTITVASKVEEGTTFTLNFPKADDK